MISIFKKFIATIHDNYFYKSGLSKQLYIFRCINNLFPNKKLTLFELGPGSGFLTALLATAGHRVFCLDNSQAFYIYQNHFLQHFGINELARKDERNFGEGPITHIPWWLWVNDDFELPKVVIFESKLFFIALNVKKAKEIEEVMKFHIMVLAQSSKSNKNFLEEEELAYLSNWEAEKYRQKV